MSGEPSASLERPVWKRRLIRLGVLIWIGVLAIFFLSLVLLSGTSPYLLDPPFHLLFGWIGFLWVTLPKMAMRWEMIFSALIALAFAMVILHVVARWFLARIGTSGAWTTKSTSAVVVAVIVLFAASFMATGIGHQVAWLRNEPMVKSYRFGENRHLSQQGNNARQIVLAIQLYAGQHDGRFPRMLEDLAPEYIEGDALVRLKHFQSHPNSEGEPWSYLGYGMTSDMPQYLPLVVSPRPILTSGEYIVAQFDGSVHFVDKPRLD